MDVVQEGKRMLETREEQYDNILKNEEDKYKHLRDYVKDLEGKYVNTQ